jgi:hypothetical protein
MESSSVNVFGSPLGYGNAEVLLNDIRHYAY